MDVGLLRTTTKGCAAGHARATPRLRALSAGRSGRDGHLRRGVPGHKGALGVASSFRLPCAGERGEGLRAFAASEGGANGSGPEIAKLDFSASKPLRDAANALDNWTPSAPGVYAVFDEKEELQYIGLSRKISASIDRHAQKVADLMHHVQVVEMPGAGKEALQGAWKAWIEAQVEATGNIPEGNRRGNDQWLFKQRAPPKQEIQLTPGKGADDLLVPMEELIDSLVKSKRVVAFIKGTRTQPECGFSFNVLNLLNGTQADYETVNVLDERHNPGLREAIKIYSDWPTIPQVYIEGEFVGGADIIQEMSESGELKKMLS